MGGLAPAGVILEEVEADKEVYSDTEFWTEVTRSPKKKGGGTRDQDQTLPPTKRQKTLADCWIAGTNAEEDMMTNKVANQDRVIGGEAKSCNLEGEIATGAPPEVEKVILSASVPADAPPGVPADVTEDHPQTSGTEGEARSNPEEEKEAGAPLRW